jgi:hypothetical protein
LTSTANGLASAANNSANTVSNGNSFTVGNSTLINISDNNVILIIVSLLANFLCCSPCCRGNRATGCAVCTQRASAFKNTEKLIASLLKEEREKQKNILEVLSQNNSLTSET